MAGSRRQELCHYMNSGRLRDAVAGQLSAEAQDLLVDIVGRYCSPHTSRRRRLSRTKSEASNA